MPPSPHATPTPSELEILSVLWREGPSTVRDVHEATGETRGSGYTTTLKLMQIMAEKGLLARDMSRRTHVYRAGVRQKATRRGLAKNLIERAFGGSAAALAAEALAGARPSAEEVRALRKLLDAAETGADKSSRKGSK